MTLKTTISSDLGLFFSTDDFAETVSYSGVDIPAIIDYDDAKRTIVGKTLLEGVSDYAFLTVKQSDVPLPVYRDVVEINAVTWSVTRVESGDGYIWNLLIKKDERQIW
jgi:hypothetical protein